MIDMVGPDEIKAWRELWAKDVSSQVAEIRRAAFQKLVMCDLALDGIKYRQRLIPEEAKPKPFQIVGGYGDLRHGPYRWINDAATALNALYNLQPKQVLETPFWREVEKVLNGVPTPNVDLGFDSPADRAARAEQERSPQEQIPSSQEGK